MYTDYLWSLLHAHCIAFLLIFSLLFFYWYDQRAFLLLLIVSILCKVWHILTFDKYHFICILLDHGENTFLVARFFLLFLIGSPIARTSF